MRNLILAWFLLFSTGDARAAITQIGPFKDLQSCESARKNTTAFFSNAWFRAKPDGICVSDGNE